MVNKVKAPSRHCHYLPKFSQFRSTPIFGGDETRRCFHVMSSVMKFTLSQRTSISLTHASPANNLLQLNSICISISSESFPCWLTWGKWFCSDVYTALWKRQFVRHKGMEISKAFPRNCRQRRWDVLLAEVYSLEGGFALKCEFASEFSEMLLFNGRESFLRNFVLAKSTLQPFYSLANLPRAVPLRRFQLCN